MKYDIVDNFAKTENISSEERITAPNRPNSPFFSVVIPTYKRPDFVYECVISAVNQNNFHEPYEIIVVDNDSDTAENETERLLRELNIPNLTYYKNKENLGGCGNWNRCVTLAKSKWIIMCHDDDLLKPDCLETMRLILEKHKNDKKEIGCIHSSVESMYADNLNIDISKLKKSRAEKKPKTAIIQYSYANVRLSGGATWAGAPTCGSLLNKDAVISVGGYNRDLSPCPDCYVPYHMLGRYGVFKTCHTLGKYRWDENDTYRKTTLIGLIREYNDFLNILAKSDKLVSFFKNENYIDCVNYYRSKAKEADVEITDDDINSIEVPKYSPIKLKMLYLMRKIHHGIQLFAAR